MWLTEEEIRVLVAKIDRNDEESARLRKQLKQGCKHVWPDNCGGMNGEVRYCLKCKAGAQEYGYWTGWS